MAFDFKKEYKEFYLPKDQPQIVTVPPMNYVAVSGTGDPNDPDGAYKQAVGILYGVAYTIKMSYKGDHRIAGYFAYVVPPLEGFWWQEGLAGVDYTRKESFNWVAVIRLPDFVTAEDLKWAKDEAGRKKQMDCSLAEFMTIDEGLCVQIMHIGPFDDEPATMNKLDAFIAANGYQNDLNDKRRHHEIYLSDVRKVEPAKYRTVIRHPIRKI